MYQLFQEYSFFKVTWRTHCSRSCTRLKIRQRERERAQAVVRRPKRSRCVLRIERKFMGRCNDDDDDDGEEEETPSYIFVFPTIRSRNDLQTSCPECCTRCRWLGGSIAALTGRHAARRMFIRRWKVSFDFNSRPLSMTSCAYSRGGLSDALGRMKSSKFELIVGTLS